MSAAASSLEFHRQIERPGAFLRREWKWILIFGGAFLVFMLGIILSIDPAFFYPRIETDQLRYLLKAKAFVETGSTVAREAINVRPFVYAATPGLLRAPFLAVFSDFDDQLRGIQIMNVVIAAASALMSAYILSWALPRRLHRWAIAFAFAFVVLSPDWLTNTFMPLPDAPYAALTQACLILGMIAVTALPGGRKGALVIMAFTVFFTIAFFVRYTAPVLLVFVGTLAWPRLKELRKRGRLPLAFIIAPLLLVLALAALESQAILGRYIWEPLDFLRHTDKLLVILHLIGSAMPAQVVPVFNIGFEVSPLSGPPLAPIFGSTPRDVAWTILGVTITATAVAGMIAGRRRFLPEILYFLAPLALLGIMTPSTTRYLMSYQPVIWIFFFTGLASVTGAWRRQLSPGAFRIAAAAVAFLCAMGILAVRSAHASRTAGVTSAPNPVTAAREYTGDVASTFRALRHFVEGRPPDKTFLIGGSGDVGRFTLISDIPYYSPDSSLAAVTREREVYAILACGSAAACAGFDNWIARQTRRIKRSGEFRYETVFDYRTGNARAIARRVIALD